MDSLDLASLCGKPERLGRDVKETRRPTQIEPRFDAVFGWFVNWNAVVRPQRRDAFASRPVIPTANTHEPDASKDTTVQILSDRQLPTTNS